MRIVCMYDADWDQENVMGILQMGLREAGEFLQRNESQIAHLKLDAKFWEVEGPGWSWLLSGDRECFDESDENDISRQSWATRRQFPRDPSWVTDRGHQDPDFSLSGIILT